MRREEASTDDVGRELMRLYRLVPDQHGDPSNAVFDQ
jgi:hypothetical protein